MASSISTATATAASQLSSFSSISRHKLHLHRRRSSLSLPSPRTKRCLVMSVEPRSVNTSSIYSNEESKPLDAVVEPPPGVAEEADVDAVDSAKVYGSAKIHDFCFGIPYGGFVLSGGLLGFIFSRNPATLGAGILFGGALLGLSTSSLKVWRQGKSSLPHVLGQAALSAALVWKNFQAYTSTKKLFPTGFYTAISTAMLCFYIYVTISGGNPPPKKLQSAAAAGSLGE